MPTNDASRLPLWEVTLIDTTATAWSERKATAHAAEEFQIPPGLRFKIDVTKIPDKR